MAEQWPVDAIKRLQDHADLQTEILQAIAPQIAEIHAAVVPTTPPSGDNRLEVLLSQLVELGQTHTEMLRRIETLLRQR